MKQELILQQSAPQRSSQLKQWQKYRGWKIRILEELQHSGGMTTHEISTRIGEKSHATTNRLSEMHRVNLVERVERWGWRITGDGLFLLSLNYTTTKPQQHHNITTTLPQQEKEETAPSCFHQSTCHIKRSCQDKRFTMKNMKLCLNCVWDSPWAWNKPKLPVEMNPMG